MEHQRHFFVCECCRPHVYVRKSYSSKQLLPAISSAYCLNGPRGVLNDKAAKLRRSARTRTPTRTSLENNSKTAWSSFYMLLADDVGFTSAYNEYDGKQWVRIGCNIYNGRAKNPSGFHTLFDNCLVWTHTHTHNLVTLRRTTKACHQAAAPGDPRPFPMPCLIHRPLVFWGSGRVDRLPDPLRPLQQVKKYPPTPTHPLSPPLAVRPGVPFAGPSLRCMISAAQFLHRFDDAQIRAVSSISTSWLDVNLQEFQKDPRRICCRLLIHPIRISLCFRDYKILIKKHWNPIVNQQLVNNTRTFGNAEIMCELCVDLTLVLHICSSKSLVLHP